MKERWLTKKEQKELAEDESTANEQSTDLKYIKKKNQEGIYNLSEHSANIRVKVNKEDSETTKAEEEGKSKY